MRRTYIDNVFEYYKEKDEGQPFPVQGLYLRRLLVVDDEASIRNMYKTIFSRRGFDVLTAGSAMEAKDLLVREHVDIVFLDINMVEVEGDTLFELIRAFHPNVKVVVSSVYPLDEQRERVRDANAYFDKSDSQDSLLKIVSTLI
ncbi:MAG: response regulator [Candidatus Omnitrophica bacterium]|nr:response regulator [Candidatus Omnitrophota bacterium]